jgi:hypothetical protein
MKTVPNRLDEAVFGAEYPSSRHPEPVAKLPTLPISAKDIHRHQNANAVAELVLVLHAAKRWR